MTTYRVFSTPEHTKPCGVFQSLADARVYARRLPGDRWIIRNNDRPHARIVAFHGCVSEVPQGQRHYTVTQGMRGWFAVEFWWNPGDEITTGGFWEPWQSDFMSFATKEEAQQRAVECAIVEELPVLVK